MTGLLFRPWLPAVTACLWWLGVFVYDFLRYAPNPSVSIPWIDWHQMYAVNRMGPWMIVPFAALGIWALLAREPRMPKSATRAFFAAAALWAAFVLWRAHEQAVTCAVWIPPEDVRSGCVTSDLLGSAVPWLAVPVVVCVLMAVPALQVRARGNQSKSSP